MQPHLTRSPTRWRYYTLVPVSAEVSAIFSIIGIGHISYSLVRPLVSMSSGVFLESCRLQRGVTTAIVRAAMWPHAAVGPFVTR